MRTTILLPAPEATERLAAAIAPRLRAGDALMLSGGLGAGKSLFARAAITARLAALGRSEDVPSPTYTLVQTYDLETVRLWHADLYRLGSVEETEELGLDEAFETAVALIEWPDRLGDRLPARRLDLDFGFAEAEDARLLTIAPVGAGWDWLASTVEGAVA